MKKRTQTYFGGKSHDSRSQSRRGLSSPRHRKASLGKPFALRADRHQTPIAAGSADIKRLSR